MTSGLHHVTLITRKVQQNVDFYAGFLGLRLVKRTAGFEDSAQLHLFYGDRLGSPGSLVSFLVWEDGAPGRVGEGQAGEIAFAIRPEAIGQWLTRALRYHVQVTGPAQEFGEPVLRLKDPDGVIVKLVGTASLSATAPFVAPDLTAEDAIQRLRAATIFTETPDETSGFISRHLGFSEAGREGAVRRLVSEAGDAIDVRDAAGFWKAAPGTGTVDHIAVRAASRDAVLALKDRLQAEKAGPTPAHDRRYFFSLYVREPGRTLLEVATDEPGFTLDESEEELGRTLFLPGKSEAERQDAAVVLPQFGLPGEEREVARDLPFIHRVNRPEAPDGRTLFLLHGSAANELSLLPLGRRVAPHALLVALRGRSLEEGVPRFYRRLTPFTFDQADIRGESEAFAAFIEGAIAAYEIDPDRAAFVGYSNGANLIAATLFLHPGLIRRAALLRSMNPLDTTPTADLKGTEVLLIEGQSDPYRKYSPELEKDLRAAQATVSKVTLKAGHLLTATDPPTIATWLDGLDPAD
ncbi:VOC family protein [Rhizobium sp. YIM 134829]|uniref:VOC family protein n=1 Tax=Rhizobium sp. YIM 134829 TaxID=3390453 RepID=UPI00397C5EDC